MTANGGFNAALFDSVFVAICERIRRGEEVVISQDNFDRLRNNDTFIEAITHSTSHVENVRTRLLLARQYLFD